MLTFASLNLTDLLLLSADVIQDTWIESCVDAVTVKGSGFVKVVTLSTLL